jgi:hypothetical protein
MGAQGRAVACDPDMGWAVRLLLLAPATHDHDDLYYRETELSAAGGGGTVDWASLASVPAGFADGIDDVGGGASYTAGAGISIVGTTISVAAGGVTGAMIADGTVGEADANNQYFGSVSSTVDETVRSVFVDSVYLNGVSTARVAITVNGDQGRGEQSPS